MADGAPGASAPAVGDEVAVLDTSDGRIVVKFFPDKAPKTVENFKTLTNKSFFDGTKFHRIVKGFMIQGGDPLTKDEKAKARWGTGDPGYKINAEFNDVPHTRGILSMARSNDPDSAGSQFYIVHQDSNFLDGKYTVFGQVVDGMKTVDAIAETPTTTGASGENSDPTKPIVVKSVKIEKWPVK
ncbi:peptidylprolyl isomerase [bacterium]|nr:MAG: peptidylprolyl isomerase [bacterium]